MNWKKINYILHRDIGFLCIGLTLLYAISGVVVNHISHDFNPSYKIEKITSQVSPAPKGAVPDMVMVKSVLTELEEYGKFKNVAFISPDNIRIFVEGNTIDYFLSSGTVVQEKVQKRPFLYELNYLHLNKPKKSWTYAADIYAILLGFLAISGLLMIRKKTIKRGVILTAIGFIIPIGYIIFLL